MPTAPSPQPWIAHNSQMAPRIPRPILMLSGPILLLGLSRLIQQAHAADAEPCLSWADDFVGNSQARFQILNWMKRGICVRQHGNDLKCYQTLEATLKNLNFLRIGEYTGAASVLALLPTIGALLGAPTTEIWRLLTVVPFGGGLAMTLSFGGAILPVRVEDYQRDLNKAKKVRREKSPNSSPSFRTRGPVRALSGEKKPGEEDPNVAFALDSILERMRQDHSLRIAKGHLYVGLAAMVALFIGAQAAIIVIEQGGVLPWWCVSRWWMHLWYFLVTLTAITENWAQLPFLATWKLFVSDIPYDVSIQNGDNVLTKFKNPDASITEVLNQFPSLRMGTSMIHGSQQRTQPRNSVLVVVSVTDDRPSLLWSLFRLLSKCTSIATFVSGTALFASVQLLALPMAVMCLTLILAAGVFGRAITGWIVAGVSKTEPLIHVIVHSQQEAQQVITQILKIDEFDDPEVAEGENARRKVQVELGGHVFVSQTRVAQRSRWFVRALGVLAEPFDLRKVDMSKKGYSSIQEMGGDQSELELGLPRHQSFQSVPI